MTKDQPPPPPIPSRPATDLTRIDPRELAALYREVQERLRETSLSLNSSSSNLPRPSLPSNMEEAVRAALANSRTRSSPEEEEEEAHSPPPPEQEDHEEQGNEQQHAISSSGRLNAATISRARLLAILTRVLEETEQDFANLGSGGGMFSTSESSRKDGGPDVDKDDCRGGSSGAGFGHPSSNHRDDDDEGAAMT